MTDYKAYNDKLFSRWAPIYDGFELLLAGIRKKNVEQINPTGKSVLDVATGTGSLAIELGKQAKSVVGIDLSEKMLAVAERKSKSNNVSFRQMDASKMAFDDDTFDIVTISLGLHDMPLEVRTKVLEESKRVLKPDGDLYILEHGLPENKFLSSISATLIDTFESRYFLPFVKSDFQAYLQSFGLKIRKRTPFLFGHLQFIELTN
jgi:demethylmenaquinone methyltransferase/2-methoxy-6-polyprenyl-1,4-benzoquinol methylase